jgi:hypothetical protein
MKYLSIVLSLGLIFSCKEKIELPLNENVNKLVIEAEVHDGAGPYYVKVSKSTVFNSTVTYLPYNVNSILITDNEGNKDSLVKYADGIYKTTTLRGKVGNTYYLTVNDNSTKYTAQSVLNSSPTIDSFYLSYFLTAENVYPSIVFNDPADQQNNYRYFVRINNKAPERMYIFEDKLINGTKWRLAAFREEYKKGDSCEFFMLGIDRPNWIYFNIIVQNQAVVSGGNNNAAPTNPPTNIIGGEVLGYFSAHSRKSVKFVIK